MCAFLKGYCWNEYNRLLCDVDDRCVVQSLQILLTDLCVPERTVVSPTWSTRTISDEGQKWVCLSFLRWQRFQPKFKIQFRVTKKERNDHQKPHFGKEMRVDNRGSVADQIRTESYLWSSTKIQYTNRE